MTNSEFYVSASPHIHNKKSRSIQKIMLYVIIALLPTTIWGIIAFGWRAALVVAVSILSAMLTEYLCDLLLKKPNSLKDLSAVVTGLLVGLNMSSAVPLYVPIIASVFAIAVCKMTFGGLGQNWVNPALGGRVFVMFSFTNAINRYVIPRFLDGVYIGESVSSASISSASVSSASVSSASQTTSSILSGATPLSYIKGLGESGISVTNALQNADYPITSFARKIFDIFHINPYYTDAFVGNIGGTIGEVSALCLIIGAIFLLCTKVITYHIPVSFIASFMIFTWIWGGVPSGLGVFHGDAIYGILSGGFMLGCLFMATDMVTTPITKKGQVIFGIGCGFFTFLFRYFASLSDGVSIAIILMNMCVPFIDRCTRPRVYGHFKEYKKSAKEAK